MPILFYNDADSFDPTWSSNVGNIKERAVGDGSAMAKSHYPYAIIEDQTELRSSASRECETWWSRLNGAQKFADRYPEVKRVYVTSFMGKYLEKVAELKQEDVEKKAAARSEAERREQERREGEQREVERNERTQRAAKVERGVVVEVTGRRHTRDGIMYSVDFFDPFRMTEAVSFGVSVKDDGLVELEHLDEEPEQPDE